MQNIFLDRGRECVFRPSRSDKFQHCALAIHRHAENCVPIDVIVTGYAVTSLAPAIDRLRSKHLEPSETAVLKQIVNKKKKGRDKIPVWTIMVSYFLGMRESIRHSRNSLWVVVP